MKEKNIRVSKTKKSIEYFVYVRQHSAALDVFTEFMKTIKFQARLILSECYSSDLPLYDFDEREKS